MAALKKCGALMERPLGAAEADADSGSLTCVPT